MRAFPFLRALRALTAQVLYFTPLLLLACAQAQQAFNTGTIVGEIRVTRASFPEMRILVEIETSGARVATVYADAEGKFAFEDLPGNLYHIIIQQEGFRPVNHPVALNPSVQRIMYVHLELTPEDKSSGS